MSPDARAGRTKASSSHYPSQDMTPAHAPSTPQPDLILARHGETNANVGGRLDTQSPGDHLSPRGYRQAAILSTQMRCYDLGAIYTSPSRRAIETAQVIAQECGLSVIVRDGLEEVSAGSLELSRINKSGEKYIDTVFAWAAGDLAATIAGGESGVTVVSRFERVIAEADEAGEGPSLIVTHGAIMRMWLASNVTNLDFESIRQHQVPNAGFVALRRPQSDGVGWQSLTQWPPVVLSG